MSKRSLNRPKKRTIVRWDDNLDDLLLLTIQSVCNTKSIKVPWDEVAKTLGRNTSEGAIVQHLAKIRSRRVEAEKEVPRPLRGAASGGYAKNARTTMGSSYREGAQLNEDQYGSGEK
ncbi:hypothetical protein BDW68DRAFT_178176 [Aspergillus falconensis]